jgi:phosphotransferase system enzyme I (PtsI)
VGICGEAAADTTMTERFLRMGVDELSVNPSMLLHVRDKIRKLNITGEK